MINYQRLFYIFKKMDSALDQSGTPTGYIKVEINGATAKLQLSVQDLYEREGMVYKLYGISYKEGAVKYQALCDIPVVKGRAEVKSEFSVDSEQSGVKFGDINVFAVISQYLYELPEAFMCSLVAYLKEEVQWKHYMQKAIKEEKIKRQEIHVSSEEKHGITASNIFSELRASINSDEKHSAIVEETTNETRKPESNKYELARPEAQNILVKENMPNTKTNMPNYNVNLNPSHTPTISLAEIRAVTEEGIQDTIEKGIRAATEEEIRDTTEEEIDLNAIAQESKQEEILDGSGNQTMEDVWLRIQKNISVQEKEAKKAKGEEVDIAANNSFIEAVEKNFKDISNINAISSSDVERTNIATLSGLKEELDKNFEICNPFKTKSKNVRWWKINSPGFVNNILFRYNIKTYLLFNPKVLLAHYKYRHIILGLQSDRHTGKEFLLCGVPSVYNIDDNPFGNMSSWVQLQGYKPKYGAFGYWMILVDPRTGKLLKIR